MAVRTRSTYGNLKDVAKNYVRSFKKRGFRDLVDRLTRDAFFQFNAANQNLIPEALQFNREARRLHQPNHWAQQSSDPGRETGDGHKVDLSFVGAGARPTFGSSHRSVCVAQGRVPGHWTVLRVRRPFHQAKTEAPIPINGWGNHDFLPDADDAKAIAKDLIAFSKSQWAEFASGQTHKEPETTGDDREVRLPHATTSVSLPEHQRPHHEQFEPNLGKPARSGPYGRDQGGKGQHKGGGKGKGKGQERGRAGMAKAHCEVRPMATLWGSLDGTRATATPGIGTNNVAGTGAGTERLYDPLWRLGHILLFACREACLTSLKYVGHCTHFEHAKAVAQRKQHQSIQLHCFDFRNSLNEFKFYFHKLLEPCAGCSRQWFYRFALIIMAVQFFLAMAFSGVNIGVVMLHHFIWRCLAGATAVLCATCIRQPGQKVSIRICLIALVLPWHPTAFIQSIRSVPWVAL